MTFELPERDILEECYFEIHQLKAKLEKAEEVVRAIRALNFGASVALPWCIDSFPRLHAALKAHEYKTQETK